MLYVDGKEEGLLVDLNKSSPTLRGDPRVDEEQDRQQTYHVDYITSHKSSYFIRRTQATHAELSGGKFGPLLSSQEL